MVVSVEDRAIDELYVALTHCGNVDQAICAGTEGVGWSLVDERVDTAHSNDPTQGNRVYICVSDLGTEHTIGSEVVQASTAKAIAGYGMSSIGRTRSEVIECCLSIPDHSDISCAQVFFCGTSVLVWVGVRAGLADST